MSSYYSILLDIESILSETFTSILPNTFGRMIQPDSADSPPLSTSRKDTTRRFVLTYNNEYNRYEMPPANQDPLYSPYTASQPLYDNRPAL
jgi:hypothetical protein